MAEVALRVQGLPIVVRIDADVWRAWGQRGPIECVLERLDETEQATWVPLELAARQLAKDLNCTQERARYRIANDLRSPKPRLRDNGKTGRDRAVEEGSLAKFRLDLRDKSLKDDGWEDDE